MHKEALKHWIRTELWHQVPLRIGVVNRHFEIVEANRSFAEAYGVWQGRPCYAVYKGRSERCESCGAGKTLEGSLYCAGALKDGVTLRFERGSGSDLVAEEGK